VLVLKIAVGSDHGGFRLKGEIIEHLKSKGIEYEDFGTDKEYSCDYADFAVKVAEAVADRSFDYGIIICGTGIGISIAANKVPGIRAALCSDTFSAHACREHNDANILALGQRVIGEGLALDIVDVFLNSQFQGDRHKTRIDKIADIEKKYCK
jgi:ribose 5-phosphate isomerase B